jgi:Tol biopolymer transport system component
VAFSSDANDLVTNDPTRANADPITGQRDVFVRDLKKEITTLVSVNRFGISGNRSSQGGVLSAHGRFVGFVSEASDLVANDSNGQGQDVFVRDLKKEITTLVSVNRFGTGSGNNDSQFSVLSADGRFVAFASYASDLVPNDTNGDSDIFVRDMQKGETTLVSVNRFGTDSGNGRSPEGLTMTPNGRFVGFVSNASDLVANDTNGTADVFVRDVHTGTTTLVSINHAGTDSGNAFSGGDEPPSLSADGRFVAFRSTASDLVANDTNGTDDVFLRDLRTGTTTLVSVNQGGANSGNGLSRQGLLSPDGDVVAFFSLASDLVPSDTNGASDVFVRDLRTQTTTLVSVNQTGTHSGNNASGLLAGGLYGLAMSDDGRTIAFESDATDLVANDHNGKSDGFVAMLTKRLGPPHKP